MKVVVIDTKGKDHEVDKSVADVLVLRHGWRNVIQKSEYEIEQERKAKEALEEEEKEGIRKVLKKLKVDFHPQLGLIKLKSLLDESLAE